MSRNASVFKVMLLCLSLIIARDITAKPPDQLKPDPGILRLTDSNLQQAGRQYKFLIRQIPADSFAHNYVPKDGKMLLSDSSDWVCGFYPGTLLYLFEGTNDQLFKKVAIQKLKLLQNVQYNTSTHDLGFMMYCSFGNAYRLMHNERYKQILITSARSLSTRFNSKVGCIRSWDSDPSHFLVIIDNMINLELLLWATKASGDSSFYKIAVSHANTTMKNHFRPDYSSYHVVDYNAATGKVQKRKTAQGYSDESAWSRGQAWGLYGFTTMYKETKDKKYLEQADHIAEFILNNPNLPADKIPYWDFNAPDIPNTVRDASAGAVMCSALIELAGYNKGETSKKYLSAAETMLKSLSSPAYKAPIGTNDGFILMHSTGTYPRNSEVDASIVYADYYFLEANLRYKNLSKNNLKSK